MPALGKILIIDDNEDVLFALHLLLEPYAEKVKVMRSPDRIVHFITDFRPDIVLLDMNFTRDTVSGQEGMDCLQEILKLDRHAVVVMMTAYADTDKAVQAIKAGATDFVSKPWENDKLLATLHAAMKLRRSQTEVGRLEERVEALSAERETPQPLLIGESEGMRNIVSTIGRLRERGEDIQLLADHFLRTYARKYKKDIRQIARDARGKLQRYAWPGNVRELQHAIERAVVLCNADTLHADDFLLHAPASPVADGGTLNLEALERNAVEKAVRLCEGNMSRAAQMLGITRYSLYRKLEKLGL
ncbi:sigma-54-dependent transcriptional regulator [Paraprevotella xylaniphila]|uniref:sigma-54-dependent transcriptional regulator n=1 Tax=Paraprevotella xylaniphila TaxID=454155 RepID=UPI0026DD1A92|nr:response regulator [Paraprevotella xylaniphila]